MRLLRYHPDDPALNLAMDEVLLDRVESGACGDTLRIWESPRPFVVLGTAQALAEEVYEDRCAQEGLPILRRCSAGGCVLQGPGCLNFSLALRYEFQRDLRDLRASYQWILGQIATALAGQGVQAVQDGISDLAMNGKKFSGNAQRRRRMALLHHGTLLYRVDYAAMARCLREPADRPDYRGTRTHRDFVAPLPLDAAAIRGAAAAVFGTDPAQSVVPAPEEIARAAELATEKYRSPAWIHRR